MDASTHFLDEYGRSLLRAACPAEAARRNRPLGDLVLTAVHFARVRAHLNARGVPDDAVQGRIADVMDAVAAHPGDLPAALAAADEAFAD